MKGKLSLNYKLNKVRAVAILALFFFLLSTFLPIAAGAATQYKYGPWSGKASSWQSGIKPLNPDAPEASGFLCVDDKGRNLSQKQQEALRSVSEAAVKIYLGEWNWEHFDMKEIDYKGADDKKGQIEDEIEKIDNFGFESGAKGLQRFLREEKKLLADKPPAALTKDKAKEYRDKGINTGDRSVWSPFTERSLTTNKDGAKDAGGYLWARVAGAKIWMDSTAEEPSPDNFEDIFPMNNEEGDMVAGLINDKAQNPVYAFSKVPGACALADFTDSEGSFGLDDFMDDTEQALMNLFLAIPKGILDALYQWFWPAAWQSSFWTAHSERGDTIWNLPEACVNGRALTDASAYWSSGKAGARKAATGSGDACKGSQMLGFSKKRIGKKGENPSYLKLASMFQWMVTGTYFLILFTSALLFIFRGNRQQTLNLMRLIPKLLLSIILTLLLPFLIGAFISFGNMAVKAVLGFSGNTTENDLNIINVMMMQMSGYFDENSVKYSILQILLAGTVAISSFVLVITAYIRQIILILLIVMAPVAVFCLIIDSWKGMFTKWIKILAAVVLLPFGLALILKIGIVSNPIFDSLTGAGKGTGDISDAWGTSVMGVLSVILTFYAMARLCKLAQGLAGGNMKGLSRGVSSLGRLAGAGLSAKGMEADSKWASWGLRALGAGASGAGIMAGRALVAPTSSKKAFMPGGAGSGGPKSETQRLRESIEKSDIPVTGFLSRKTNPRLNERDIRKWAERKKAAKAKHNRGIKNQYKKWREPNDAEKRTLSRGEAGQMQEEINGMRGAGFNNAQIMSMLGLAAMPRQNPDGSMTLYQRQSVEELEKIREHLQNLENKKAREENRIPREYSINDPEVTGYVNNLPATQKAIGMMARQYQRQTGKKAMHQQPDGSVRFDKDFASFVNISMPDNKKGKQSAEDMEKVINVEGIHNPVEGTEVAEQGAGGNPEQLSMEV